MHAHQAHEVDGGLEIVIVMLHQDGNHAMCIVTDLLLIVRENVL
jgi:hypothetical protein